ncbi:MAG: flagellar hook-associated protein FlgK [Bryobacteraceae bacterium]
MGNLLSSLVTVADSMRTVQKAIDVSSNNVTNANTPGFVRQDLSLVAKRFELDHALPGGVGDQGLISSRRAFLELGVYEQAGREGRYAQLTSNLERLEPLLDVTAQGGVSGALDNLFAAFSQWSVNPNDQPSRQRVIDRAADLGNAFRFLSGSITASVSDAAAETGALVGQVNRLGQRILEYNVEVRQDRRKLEDPGLDAQVHAALEELSGLVDFDLIRSEDGSFTVQLGGQTPLVIGDHTFPVSVEAGNGPIVLRDSLGRDITGQIGAGKVKGILEFADSSAGVLLDDVNTLAAAVADQVNGTLANGVDRNGVPGAELFSYDNVTGAAASLTVTSITADELAAAAIDAPGGNANALDLAALSTSRVVNGYSFSQFLGQTAGQLGQTLGNARESARTHELLLGQARQLRAASSEVDLNAEAVKLVAFQRQYEANAELVRVLNSLTETMLGILR